MTGPTKRFVLLYGELEVGSVVQEDQDFPNCFGSWAPSLGDDQATLREHIAAYVRYSEHADALMAGSDVSNAWESYVRECEPRFFDLINSGCGSDIDGESAGYHARREVIETTSFRRVISAWKVAASRAHA